MPMLELGFRVLSVLVTLFDSLCDPLHGALGGSLAFRLANCLLQTIELVEI